MIRPLVLTLSVTAAALLSACVVAPYGYNGGYAAPVDGPVVIAPMAPPPPLVEVQPAMPFYGAIWIGGFWNWVGGRHVWVGGHWDHPRDGYRWHPHQWEQRGNQWNLRGGWRRDR